jgi:hypothetical protein
MHHTGTISNTDLARPFHAQCSCGTAGDFANRDAAHAYLAGHFGKLSGIATTEWIEEQPAEDTPAQETPAPTPAQEETSSSEPPQSPGKDAE